MNFNIYICTWIHSIKRHSTNNHNTHYNLDGEVSGMHINEKLLQKHANQQLRSSVSISVFIVSISSSVSDSSFISLHFLLFHMPFLMLVVQATTTSVMHKTAYPRNVVTQKSNLLCTHHYIRWFYRIES